VQSISTRSLNFLKRYISTWMWAKEYRKTVCRSGVYMLLIRKGRKMSDEWIYDIIPREQVESINKKADKTLYNMSGGISLVLTTDNQSAVDLCQNWRMALQGSPMAWIKVSSFLAGIIETIEQHLFDEDINPYEQDDDNEED
jgi:hypothetical protein